MEATMLSMQMKISTPFDGYCSYRYIYAAAHTDHNILKAADITSKL